MREDRAARYPFSSSEIPLTIVGGDGNHLIASDGRRILDGAGGAVVNNIGYGRAEIAEVAAQALTGTGYVVPIWATEARISLIERLVDRWLPTGLTRCLFVAGGSESVDTAMRIARQHHVGKGNTDRWKILGRNISYHGATLASLAAANHDRRKAPFGPMMMDLPKVDVYDADQVIKVIETEDPSTVAALIMEPVIGASGAAIVAPDDYWPKLRRYCTDNQVLLIADEVMTGVGRTGRKFGVDHWDVTPDILVGSKGLGGGYVPVGGVFTTEAVVEPITDRVMYFTFSAANISCAVADRVLRIIEEEQLVERCETMGALFATMLTDALGEHPNVADVRGLGLLRGVELVKDRETGASFDGTLAEAVVAEALSRDCWIYPAGSGPVPDALLFGPSFTVTEDELEQIVAITKASIDAAVAGLA